MKVLFDQNVADNLRTYLSHHEVSVSYLMGWGRLTNGRLLAAAEEAGFEVLITGDQKPAIPAESVPTKDCHRRYFPHKLATGKAPC